MSCMEVWGGSQLTERGVEFGGLDAWVYSKPYGQAQRGGGGYYASGCATGPISRLLLAGVAGDGKRGAPPPARPRAAPPRGRHPFEHTGNVRPLTHQIAAP